MKITGLAEPIPAKDAITKSQVDAMMSEDTPNSVDFISEEDAMDNEPNGNKVYSDKVTNHLTRSELNGYDLTTQLRTDDDGNQKLTFTLEKDGEFSEKELRYFEIGLKKSVGGYDPNKKRSFNHGRPQNRYNKRRPHPNYTNQYGNGRNGNY